MYRPGDDLGRYRIVETIGLGGMGIVYRGRDGVLGRDVAIKAMTGDVASNPSLRRRFLQELENAPRVVHPFVTTVFDVLDRPEGPLLVMERVDGERFDHYVQDKQPPLPTIARLGAEIAEALASIHAVGMVHRDLKPGNVLVTPDAHPKVMDFGVALRLPGFDRTNLATGSREERHTDSGAVVGTIAYMSPEQLRGEEPREASDLFSLGIMLCEAVTGHHPFSGETSAEIAAAILHEPPGTEEDRRRLRGTGELGATILRLLDKNPEKRPASAREAADRLHFASTHVTAPEIRARRRIASSLLAGTLVVAALAGAVYGLKRAYSTPNGIEGPVSTARRPAVAVLPFASGAGSPGESVGRMVADLIGAQLGESSRLRPVAADRVDEVLSGLPKDSQTSALRSRLAQATPASWIVSGTLYAEGSELLASVSVFGREGNEPAATFRVRGTKPSQLATQTFERLQEVTGAAEIAGFLPARSLPVVASDPDAADLLRRGRDAARALEYAKGIDLLDEALRRDPKFLDAQILQADLLERAGYERRATQVAGAAIALAQSLGLPDDARQRLEAEVARASIQGGAGYEKAIERLADRYPDEPDLVREHALAIRRSQPDRATALAHRAVEIDPQDGRHHLALARVLAAQQRIDDALLEIDAAERLFRSFGLASGLAEATSERGRVLSRGGRWAPARAAFHDAASMFDKAGHPTLALAATVDEANMALKGFDLDAAGALYRSATPGLEAAGDFSAVVFALEGYGGALLRQGRFSEAEAALADALRAARTLDNPRLTAVPLLDLATLYTQTGRFGQARALSQEILTQGPDGAAAGVRCSAGVTAALADAGTGEIGAAMDRLDRQIADDLAACGADRIALAAAQLAWFAVQAENPARAVAALDRAVSLVDGTKPPVDLAFYLAERTRLRASLGAAQAAADDLARAETIAGDLSSRGAELRDDLRLAKASLAVARGEIDQAVAASALVEPSAGAIREALVELRAALLIAAKRTGEAKRLLGPSSADAALGLLDRIARRRLGARLLEADGRRDEAVAAVRALLTEIEPRGLSRTEALIADVGARAASSRADREDFAARRTTALGRFLVNVPPDHREWVRAHWGEPGSTPAPTAPAP